MRLINLLKSGGIILLVAFLTVLLTTILLIVLNQAGLIAFTGGGWLIDCHNLIAKYLGNSVPFFVCTFLGYSIFFFLLNGSLSRDQSRVEDMENIRFYSGGMELFITFFFGIGVLFTAWGLQNALVSALGGVSKTEAARLGAWGILTRLVDNGILIALWTTIVGGAGGYLMRFFKYVFLGKRLSICTSRRNEEEKQRFFEALESIRLHVKNVEQRINRTTSSD